MVTTGAYTSATLAAEAAELDLPSFSPAQAVALGLLATDRAITDSLPIVVSGVGVVGGFYASGLPDVEDHRFLVQCLRDLQGS